MSLYILKAIYSSSALQPSHKPPSKILRKAITPQFVWNLRHSERRGESSAIDDCRKWSLDTGRLKINQDTNCTLIMKSCLKPVSSCVDLSVKLSCSSIAILPPLVRYTCSMAEALHYHIHTKTACINKVLTAEGKELTQGCFLWKHKTLLSVLIAKLLEIIVAKSIKTINHFINMFQPFFPYSPKGPVE